MTTPAYRIVPCEREFGGTLFYILEKYMPNRFLRGGKWSELGRHDSESHAMMAMLDHIKAVPLRVRQFNAIGKELP